MSSNLILRFTPEARTDLLEIFEYISNKLVAPMAASNLIDKIEAECKRLTSFPLIGSIPRDDTLAKKGYRMLDVNNFIVFYTVDEPCVIIMRVMYGRRNYSHLL